MMVLSRSRLKPHIFEILHASGSNVQLISTIRMINLSKLAYLLSVQSAQKYQELVEQR